MILESVKNFTPPFLRRSGITLVECAISAVLPNFIPVYTAIVLIYSLLKGERSDTNRKRKTATLSRNEKKNPTSRVCALISVTVPLTNSRHHHVHIQSWAGGNGNKGWGCSKVISRKFGNDTASGPGSCRITVTGSEYLAARMKQKFITVVACNGRNFVTNERRGLELAREF